MNVITKDLNGKDKLLYFQMERSFLKNTALTEFNTANLKKKNILLLRFACKSNTKRFIFNIKFH